MSVADVLIVGGGPAGGTAAAQLAAQGIRTMLVDRARFPRDKPCGDYCNPGAVRLLDGMGLLPALLAQRAALIDAMTVVAQDGSAFCAPFPSGPGLLVPRRRLDVLLAERAGRAGAEFVEGYQVDRVSVDGHVAVADLGRRVLGAQLLIAADGMRSVVAQRLGLLRALPRGRYAVGAYFSGVPHAAAGELHLGDGLYGGVARFGDGTANVCLALPRRLFRGRSPEAAFSAGLQTLPVLRDVVPAWRRESPFRITGPLGFAAHPVLQARTLLAGDAAAQIEPLTGQGIYFAIRSGLLAAEAAAGALDRGDLSARGLAAYGRRRTDLFGRKLRVMKVVAALGLRPRLTLPLMGRLRADARLAQTLLGAAGDDLPPESVHSVGYVTSLLVGLHAHDA